MTRDEALRIAGILINGSRAQQYGDAVASMERIAALFGAYLGIELKAKDAAALLALLKISRISSSEKADNWIDLIGYAAIGAETENVEWEQDLD